MCEFWCRVARWGCVLVRRRPRAPAQRVEIAEPHWGPTGDGPVGTPASDQRRCCADRHRSTCHRYLNQQAQACGPLCADSGTAATATGPFLRPYQPPQHVPRVLTAKWCRLAGVCQGSQEAVSRLRCFRSPPRVASVRGGGAELRNAHHHHHGGFVCIHSWHGAHVWLWG
jgi:hypothetical protein